MSCLCPTSLVLSDRLLGNIVFQFAKLGDFHFRDLGERGTEITVTPPGDARYIDHRQKGWLVLLFSELLGWIENDRKARQGEDVPVRSRGGRLEFSSQRTMSRTSPTKEILRPHRTRRRANSKTATNIIKVATWRQDEIKRYGKVPPRTGRNGIRAEHGVDPSTIDRYAPELLKNWKDKDYVWDGKLFIDEEES